MLKNSVTIDRDRCKGCELCISVCPRKILELDRRLVNKAGYYPIKVMEKDDCIGCLSCARMCPEVAIKIERAG